MSKSSDALTAAVTRLTASVQAAVAALTAGQTNPDAPAEDAATVQLTAAADNLDAALKPPTPPTP